MKIEPISAQPSSQSAKVSIKTVSHNMAGEFDVSWGIFDEYFVEDIRGEFGQNERMIPEQKHQEKHANMSQCF